MTCLDQGPTCCWTKEDAIVAAAGKNFGVVGMQKHHLKIALFMMMYCTLMIH